MILIYKLKISQEKYEDYGIYDIKAQKQVLKGTYEDIDYLHDDIFSAEKNNKSGIIDVNNIDNKLTISSIVLTFLSCSSILAIIYNIFLILKSNHF